MWVSAWPVGYPSFAWEVVAYTDHLNDVTIGNSAYNYYQAQRNNLVNDQSKLADFFLFTGLAGAAIPYFLLKIITAADAALIGIVITIEAFALEAWISSVQNSLHTLYDSTYVEVLNGMHGSNAGAPYMWTEFTVVDAWGYGLSALGDRVSLNGYKYSGSKINLVPSIPIPVVSTAIAMNINSVAQSVASSGAGNGNWAYEGSYN